MRKTTPRKGAAIVEFAIVLPVIVTILVAIVDINALIYAKQSSKIACYEGCRAGIVAGATSENVEAQVREILASRRVRDYSIEITPANVSTMVHGDDLTVRVQLNAASNVYLGNWFGIDQIDSSVSMRCEL